MGHLDLDGDRYAVTWLPAETFSGDWESRWAIEGNCPVAAVDGRLAVRGTPNGVSTVWYRRPLPRDLIVRIRAAAVAPADENAANLNLFLHANEADGRPLQFGREGAYAGYHHIPNYLATFTGGFAPGYARLRRNPGFELFHEDTSVRAEIGPQYDIVVTVLSGRLRYYLDGRRIHDWSDPAPLPAGYFGLRTWSTNVEWREVAFGAISSP